MKMETLNAATRQGPPGATGNWEKQATESPLETSEGVRACQHLVFRSVASTTVRKLISVVLSLHVYHNVLGWSQKTDMPPHPQPVQSLILESWTSEIRSSK